MNETRGTDSTLIRVSDTFLINPAFVAYAERDDQGRMTMPFRVILAS